MVESKLYEMIARADRKINDPAFIDLVCIQVSGGGSVLDLAREWDIPYAYLMRMIRTRKDWEAKYQTALSDRNEHVIESTLHLLNSIRDFDIRSLYRDSGDLKPISEWPIEASLVVSGIKPTKEGIEIKLAERLKAVELIGKNKHLFTERHEVTGKVTLIDLITQSWDRGTDGNQGKTETAAAAVERNESRPEQSGADHSAADEPEGSFSEPAG